MLKWLYIFEKRAANLIGMQKNNSFYVKIGLWILTTNFTKTAINKEQIRLSKLFLHFLINQFEVLLSLQRKTIFLSGNAQNSKGRLPMNGVRNYI